MRRLYQEFARFLAQPEVKRKFFVEGTEAPGSTPEEFAALIRSDMKVLGKVIRDAGIREQ